MEQQLIPYQAQTVIPARTILVFAPHPDDEIFGCGGTLARQAAAGIPIHLVVVTDGAFSATAEERSTLIATREAESRAAAAALGIPAPAFWRLPDRGLEYGEALIVRLIDTMREHDADLVYAPSLHEAHPDHRALAMAAVEAVRRIGAGVRLAMYEIGVPLRPNVLVDITSLLERKRAAMRCFVSQLAQQRYDEQIESLNRFRAYTLPAEVRAAEAFELVTATDIAHNHLDLFASEYQRRHRLGLASDGQNDLPLVSVIVRSMNRQTLAEALDSVALQTYPHIEVVVVNAFGPGHGELGQACGRFPLRFVSTNAKLRRSAAANAGLEMARGALLGFLDDDDIILPNHIANLVEALGGSPALRAAYSMVRCIDGKGLPLEKEFGRPFSHPHLMAGNYIPIHAVLFRRDEKCSSCRFDETLDYYEDWDFWLQLAETGAFQYLPTASALYRITEQGGFGVHGCQSEEVKQALLSLVAKWRQLWSAAALGQLMEAALGGFAAADKLAIATDELAIAAGKLAIAADEQATMASDLRELHVRHSALLAEMDRSRSALQAVHDHNGALAAELSALRASHSWRFTAPLRFLSSMLKIMAGRAR